MLSYFSPKKQFARFDITFHKLLKANKARKLASVFSKEFSLLVHKEEGDLLSQLIICHLPKIQDTGALRAKLPSQALTGAATLLQGDPRHDDATLNLCDAFHLQSEAISFLARRGRAYCMLTRITADDSVAEALLTEAMKCWEQHHGDIRNSPVLCDGLKKLAGYAKDRIPLHPQAREVIGDFRVAAELYESNNDLEGAARCYESAGANSDALRVYHSLYDRSETPALGESLSRVHEALGNIEKAFNYATMPERRIRLLIELDRFVEAKIAIADLQHSRDPLLTRLVESARSSIGAKLLTHQFSDALRFLEFADLPPSESERILELGRQHFDKQVVTAASEEELNAVYKGRAHLEESAGQFEIAADIAANILHDAQYASLLYKKADRFDLALNALQGSLSDGAEDSARLLELASSHEEGGSLLEAAKHYASAGQYEKASELYERSQLYAKALECYLKASTPLESKLLELYKKAGEYESLISLLLKAGTVVALAEALSVAKEHGLPTHGRHIQNQLDALVSESEEKLERCFEQAKSETLAMYSDVIGIDFGTTNSVAALFNKSTNEPEVIQTPDGNECEPSYFGVSEDHESLFGEGARKRSLTHPDWVASRVKRALGRRKAWSLGGASYSSEQIIAEVLQHLLRNAQHYIRVQIEKRLCAILQESRASPLSETLLRRFTSKQPTSFTTNRVVLTVPAYFNDSQKRAMRDSAEIAGFQVERLLHEPTAAALAYGYRRSTSGHVAVVDLGGGTLDVSILDIAEKVYDVQSVGGDTQLGGSDIDRELTRHVARDIEMRLGIDIRKDCHSGDLARLRDACEDMKRQLSFVARHTMELRFFLNVPLYTYTMTRGDLEALCAPMVQRVRNVVRKSTQSLGAPLDGFILVGNATRMPIIRQVLKDTIDAAPLASIDPGTIVAKGAALQGAILSGDLKDALVVDVVPHSLGIAILDKDTSGRQQVMSILIEGNSRIPVQKAHTYTTTYDNQVAVELEIFQGEARLPQQNHQLGSFMLAGIKPAPAGVKKIDVTFDIGADCILTVSAVDQESGNAQSVTISDTTILSPAEKERWGEGLRAKARVASLASRVMELKRELEQLISTYNNRVTTAEQAILEVFEVFAHITSTPENYNPTKEQTICIREIFQEKEAFSHGIPPRFRDRFTSATKNLDQSEKCNGDFMNPAIIPSLQERIATLEHYRDELEDLLSKLDQDVTLVITGWKDTLTSIAPMLSRAGPVGLANHYLFAGRVEDARGTLEAGFSSPEGLSKDGIQLLLKCYARAGQREEYNKALRSMVELIGVAIPDFSNLNTYLKEIGTSVVLVQGNSQAHGVVTGSGFAIGPSLIATNRHVIEEVKASDVKIIGKKQLYLVNEIVVDPISDIAILKIEGELKPLRLGESNFVEPGERVFAIGFPVPDSSSHSDNVYISTGYVNSIRKLDLNPERVIFMDAKIGGGMSGGPLFNSLGEVIGIVTCLYASIAQPVALPNHLVKKYLVVPIARSHEVRPKS